MTNRNAVAHSIVWQQQQKIKHSQEQHGNNTILCMLTEVTTLKSGRPSKIYKKIYKTEVSQYTICYLIAGVL